MLIYFYTKCYSWQNVGIRQSFHLCSALFTMSMVDTVCWLCIKLKIKTFLCPDHRDRWNWDIWTVTYINTPQKRKIPQWKNPLFWNKVLCEDTLIVYIVVKYVLKYLIIKIPHYVCILIVLYLLDGQKQITYSRHHDILIPAYIGMSSLYQVLNYLCS